jgi:hypothetical protein
VHPLYVGVSPGGGEVVYHEHRVLGVEHDGFERVGCARPRRGEMRGVHLGPEVLLHERSEGCFEQPRSPGEMLGKIGITDNGARDRGHSWNRDALRAKVDQAMTGANGVHQRFALRWVRQDVVETRRGRSHIEARDRAICAEGASSVKIDPHLTDAAPADVGVHMLNGDMTGEQLDRGARVVPESHPRVHDGLRPQLFHRPGHD